MYFGKPFNEIYKQAMTLLNIQDTTKILAIGDSLETDIKGANSMNIDTLLVLTGLH